MTKSALSDYFSTGLVCGGLAILLTLGACDDGGTKYAIGELKQAQGNQKKLSAPLQCSEYTELTGDPCVIKDSDTYRIYYTGLDKEISGGGIGSALSRDGITWTLANSGDQATGKGLVLHGQHGTWQHQLETAFVFNRNGKYYLYYCGYPEVGWPTNPGQIGVAVSSDGIQFKRPIAEPILRPTPKGYDANGLYSPTVIHDGKQFVMIYAGHCYESDRVTPGIYLLGATSPDGIKWNKLPQPVLAPAPTPSWMANGVAEPDLIKATDGKYYLFFTANLGDDQARLIAVARGDSPLGPWQIHQQPLLTGTPGSFDNKGVLAPTVLIENNRLRLWYLTSDDNKHMTGYAEMPWPIEGW